MAYGLWFKPAWFMLVDASLPAFMAGVASLAISHHHCQRKRGFSPWGRRINAQALDPGTSQAAQRARRAGGPLSKP